MKKRCVVVAGCGFGGIEAALTLKRELKEDVHVICIDKKKHHTFYGAIYKLLSSSMIPEHLHTYYVPLFERGGIQFFRDEIVKVDPNKQVVKTKRHKFAYDYLILNPGSDTNYFNTKGMKHVYPIKSVGDILALMEPIRNKFSHYLDVGRFKHDADAHFVMVGGGLSGVEVICELALYLSHEAQKYGIPKNELSLAILDAKENIVPNFSKKVQRIVTKRVRSLGIHIITSATVKKVTNHAIHLLDGRSIPSGSTMWAAGIRPGELCERLPFKKDKKGYVSVNAKLQTIDQANVYACGDAISYFDNQEEEYAPKLAAASFEQGRHVGMNVVASILRKRSQAYHFHKKPSINIHLGGKISLLVKNEICWYGRIPYYLKQYEAKKYLGRYR